MPRSQIVDWDMDTGTSGCLMTDSLFYGQADNQDKNDSGNPPQIISQVFPLMQPQLFAETVSGFP